MAAHKPAGPVADGQELAYLMRAIKDMYPDQGWIILNFPYEQEGHLANYVSTANREDCIKFLRETADRLEKRTDFQTPNNN